MWLTLVLALAPNESSSQVPTRSSSDAGIIWPPSDRMGNTVQDSPAPLPPSVLPQTPIPLDPSLPPPPPGWDPQTFWGDDGRPADLLPPLTSHRDGFFQRLFVSAAWLPRLNRDLGVTEFQTYVTVAVPAPTRRFPLLVTPSFRYFSLDGPTAVDVPAEVFDTWLEAMWLPRINDHWQAIISVSPGVYADFDSYGSDAVRITGRGLVRYQPIPDELEFVAGLLYLNREDIRLLPAGGILWVPNRDTRFELFFPKPKIARRYRFGERFEDWVYAAAEFGGDTYWVRRAAGNEDLLTLRDFRIYFGTERKWDGGRGIRLEVGYVFGRRVEYRSDPTEYELDDTVMLRMTFAH